jgi:hypothetical protein
MSTKTHTTTIDSVCVLSISLLKKSFYPVSINRKDEQSLVLPPCPRCGATMDLKRVKDFGSRHISNDGKLYYCNNPVCPPDEWERKQRLLPFSFS